MIIDKKNIFIVGIITLIMSIFFFYNYEEKSITQVSTDIEIVEQVSLKEKKLNEIKSLIKENEDKITKLVNKDNGIEKNYIPNDLVSVNVASTKNNILVSQCIKTSLKNMFEAGKEEGMNLYLVSGYRSSDYQAKLYANALKKYSKSYTQKYVAKANHSEHQTGLAVDISAKSINYRLTRNFESTDEGKWLAENAHKYGFILRYKKDRVDDTGYGYEPWHFRYVGKEIATYIYENDLILEDLY